MSLADVALAIRTRSVGAEPPHHPEPFPGEPFAPVYDHRPLGPADTEDYWIGSPRHPDPIVFGGDGQPRHDPSGGPVDGLRACARCDVRWAGFTAVCWNCRRLAT